MIQRTIPTRPQAGLALSLAAVAGLALGFAGDLFDAAMGHKEEPTPMISKNQELLYGLRRAIEAVEACDKGGVEVGTILVDGFAPSITIANTPAPALAHTSSPGFNVGAHIMRGVQ